MARSLKVEIIGDASSLSRAFKDATGHSSTFGGALKGAVVAGAALATAGVGLLAVGLEKSVKAAMAGQVSQAALDTALRNTGQSLSAMKGPLEAAEAASRKLGFTDDETRASLARLETATGDTGKAVKDLSVAEDLARLKHIDLSTATQFLTGTLAGNTRSAKQLGLVLIPTTANMDALKEKYKQLGTEIPVAEKAQAKILDKMATGQAAIQAVTDKIHGQAEAYSKTAAGGMAQFHAQLTHIAEGIGNTLLPALSRGLAGVAGFVSDFAAKFSEAKGFKAKIEVVIGTVEDLAGKAATLAGEIASAIKEQLALVDWAAVGGTIGRAIGFGIAAALKAAAEIEKAVGDKLESIDAYGSGRSLGQRLSQGISDGVKSGGGGGGGIGFNFKTWIESVWPAVFVADHFKQIGQLVGGFMVGITAGIRSQLSQWQTSFSENGRRITADVTAWLGALPGKLAGLAGRAGRAIVDGFKGGLANLAATVITGTLPIPKVLEDLIGKAFGLASRIGSAIIGGVLSGLSGLYGAVKGKIEGVLSSVLGSIDIPGFSPPKEAAAKAIGLPLAAGVIEGWITGSMALPAKLAASVRTAIEAARQAIEAGRSALQTAWGSLASGADAAFDAITGKVKTASEKLIDIIDNEELWRGLNKNIEEAKTALAAALEGGDPAAIAAAQETLRVAWVASIRQTAVEKAVEERKQMDAENALRKTHFDEALAALEAHLAQTGASREVAHKAIVALFKKFGIDYQAAGEALGNAFAQGLRESEAAVTAAAAAIAEIARRGLGGKGGGGGGGGGGSGGWVPLAAGGIVTSPTLALLGEGSSPEAVIPLDRMTGGGGSIVLNFPNYVGDKTDLMNTVRSELGKLQNRQGRSGLR